MPAALFSWSGASKHIRYVIATFVILTTVSLLFRLDQTGHDTFFTYRNRVNETIPTVQQNYLQTIQNATLGFEVIQAINLAERTDHRDALVLASAVSNLHIDFTEGVHGSEILEKVLPVQHVEKMSDAAKGSWRAHINALRRVVENHWSTALVMEDDVDWDIRLRAQLRDIAIASNFVLRSRGNDGFVSLKDIKTRSIPQTSPYGDNWDVIWLGHCGMGLPQEVESTVVLLEDDTVPEVQYQKSWDAKAEPPLTNFSKHTRAVMASTQGTCSLAYAVSQKGARQLLFSLGLGRLDAAFDLMLRDWCQGINGHEKHVCIGVLPQVFDHHRRVGPSEIDSDISTPDGSSREKAYTPNIRWSVYLNMDKLLKGDTDYYDQYPDVS